jgi:hypothetical protein
MSSPPSTPAQWRLRAEETRAIADSMQGADGKRILYALADDYDRIATELARELGKNLDPVAWNKRRRIV